jgi:hypothetical protein
LKRAIQREAEIGKREGSATRKPEWKGGREGRECKEEERGTQDRDTPTKRHAFWVMEVCIKFLRWLATSPFAKLQ